MISTIASSAPPTSFQLVIFPVKISVSCAFVRFLTPPAVTSLFTIGAIVTTHTLWSTSSAALAASSFSAASTSELPMLTVPSDTCLSPSPEPPASIVMLTSGYFSLKRSAASSTSGFNADEPAAVMLPLRLESASAPLSALLLPQPTSAVTIHTVLRITAALFLKFIFLINFFLTFLLKVYVLSTDKRIAVVCKMQYHCYEKSM